MKTLLELIERPDLIGIAAMKTELGYKTKRRYLHTLIECEKWLQESNQNSLRFIFDNDEVIDFKL